MLLPTHPPPPNSIINGRSGAIDAVANLAYHRNYIFAGTLDPVVSPINSHQLETFFLAFQSSSQILTEFTLAAGHSQPTDSYGNPCYTTLVPYIVNCDYDSAGALLQHMYATDTLSARVSMVSANLVEFDQTPFSGDSFQSSGYVYVPTACQTGSLCSLHVAFHGCTQNTLSSNIGLDFVSYAGYNTWAEANNIIILYPQVQESTLNPEACWDWWGYSGSNYATKSGSQMVAVKAMVDTIMAGSPTSPSPSSTPTASPTHKPSSSPMTSPWPPLSLVLIFAFILSCILHL